MLQAVVETAKQRGRPKGVVEQAVRPQPVRARGVGKGKGPGDRIMEARAQMAELDLAHRQGVLLDRDTIRKVWSKRMVAFRARALALPSKIAAQLATPSKRRQAEDVVRAMIYELLTELADGGNGDGDETPLEGAPRELASGSAQKGARAANARRNAEDGVGAPPDQSRRDAAPKKKRKRKKRSDAGKKRAPREGTQVADDAGTRGER